MKNQMLQQHENERLPDNDGITFLTFVLNAEVYGINILDTKEIVDYGNITRVPMMPGFIAGVINLRGSVVPVIDLALRLSQEPSKKTKQSSIVIVQIMHDDQSIDIGIAVDTVNEVLDIKHTDIEQAPTFGTKIRADFINGVGKLENQLLILLDIGNILSITELSLVHNSNI